MRWIFRFGDWYRHRARQRTWPADKALGRRGEDLTHRYLQGRGYVVVARNYRTRSGSAEVDLIAWDAQTLVFVEVKSRRTGGPVGPEAAVDAEKRSHLRLAAAEYTRRAEVDISRVRFDVVSIVFADSAAVTHFRNAF